MESSTVNKGNKPKLQWAFRISWIVLAAVPFVTSTAEVFLMQAFDCIWLSYLVPSHERSISCYMYFQGVDYGTISHSITVLENFSDVGFTFLWPAALIVLIAELLVTRIRKRKSNERVGGSK